jgi:hypothetical protein
MSFYYLNQNAKNVNSPFENFGQNDGKFNFENFENMPPVDQEKSDGSYQCSDNVQTTGNAIGSSITNTTLANCKAECKSEGSCIGFDFDNSSSSCTLRNTITDLSSVKQNNVMCVKKTSSACKINPQVDPGHALGGIFGEAETPGIPGIPPTVPGGSTCPTPPPAPPAVPSVPPTTNPIPKPSSVKSEQCKPDTIYVDLSCFLSKMDILKNHSDNLMIDLQLLITNLKSCSYIKKVSTPTPSPNPFQPINGPSVNPNDSPTSPVIMPTQETIKVYNSQASVLYTNNPSNGANVMLGISEPFENSEQSESESFFNTFSFKLIVLILVVLFLMNLK